MVLNKHKQKQIDVPSKLQTIPDAPKTIFAIGSDLEELLKAPRVAIVGSRKMSPYGRGVTETLASQLSNRGIVIVSGLAYGVDACAHKAALESGGKAIAVLACGLDRIYPQANAQLGQRIIGSGGVIVSEYSKGTEPLRHRFLERNRIISGLSDAVLITEAAERSGSLNTAGHALNQGIPVMAVPGNVTSPLSAGTNNLIKSGAIAVTNIDDVLLALGISKTARTTLPVAYNPEEFVILTLLKSGLSEGAELLLKSELKASAFNQTLTMLEIAGKVKPLGNNHWGLA